MYIAFCRETMPVKLMPEELGRILLGQLFMESEALKLVFWSFINLLYLKIKC